MIIASIDLKVLRLSEIDLYFRKVALQLDKLKRTSHTVLGNSGNSSSGVHSEVEAFNKFD